MAVFYKYEYRNKRKNIHPWVSLKQRKYALFRTVGHISVDPEGFISSIDTEAEALFQVKLRQDCTSFEFDLHRSEAENALGAL